jgi:hypothetical protein
MPYRAHILGYLTAVVEAYRKDLRRIRRTGEDSGT